MSDVAVDKKKRTSGMEAGPGAGPLGATQVLAMVGNCTWGIVQTLVGLVVFLVCLARGCWHGRYRGCVVTVWGFRSGVSLGLFVFVRDPLVGDNPLDCPFNDPARRLLVHEYGHVMQSLMLGPLYVPLILLPSMVWAGYPALKRRRLKQGVSYYSFYTERWANSLAARVTGERPMGMSRR